MTNETDSAGAKFLLGSAGALQVLLTAVGASNGALVAVAINNLPLLIVGVGLVGLAVVVGAIIRIANLKELGQVILSVGGLAALVGGIGVTGYIALLGPSMAKAPDLDVAVSGSSGHLSLVGEVKVSGISQDAHYWVEVDARQYNFAHGAGSYTQLGTPLYQAQLGADSQGNIDTKFAVPLAARQYPAVSVEAWYGTQHGPCGSLTVTGGASLTDARAGSSLEQHSRPGCVVVRLTS
jgi:hypothetical protein